MHSCSPKWSRPFVFAPMLAMFASSGSAVAQCANEWRAVVGVAGTDGEVRATTRWDPDGAGPLPPVVVGGGDFEIAGAIAANHVATYDPALGAWSALGSGLNGAVHALAVLPNGDLVAGGAFTIAGGVAANRIARWNGTNWAPLGTGISTSTGDALVLAFASLPNGDLVAAGHFDSAGGASANHIARWDGANWSALGAGMQGPSDEVRACTVLATGDLVVGGRFAMAGGVQVNNIARWDGSTWSGFGSGTGVSIYANVYALTTRPNGELVVGGSFVNMDGVFVSNIARWNGVSWSQLLFGIPNPNAQVVVMALATQPNGDLVVGGQFSGVYGVSVGVGGIARWDGTNWSAFGPGTNGVVRAVTTLPNGDVVAGGGFVRAGGLGVRNFAVWNGTAWSSASPGINDSVFALAPLPNGDLAVGGRFTTVGGVSASGLARWDGVNWFTLGAGPGSVPWVSVECLLPLPSGELVVGGMFTDSSGISRNKIARWDGTTWTTLGLAMTMVYPLVGTTTVSALLRLPNGDLVAAGKFSHAGAVPVNHIARWDGVTWSPLGSGVEPQSDVRALALLPNGDLVAGGAFRVAGGAIVNRTARWDGTTWSPLGNGVSNGASSSVVHAFTTLPNGDLVAGGEFTVAGSVAANRVARWDGANWSSLGSGMNGAVASLRTLPNGDVVAGGLFTLAGGVSVANVARWNGASWSGLGTGTNRSVNEMTSLPNADVIAAGDFTIVDGAASAYVARLTTTCPATASQFGSGCPSSGGANVLAATTLPWIGSTFRATATGLPATSIVLTLTSVTPIGQGVLPLTIVFPQAGVGCDVLVWPDLLGALVTTTGTAEFAWFLPPSSPLIGLPFYHQMVAIDVNGVGAWVAVTATNALQLFAGDF